MLGKVIEIETGFETDFASVPRLPIVYTLWGNQTHREPSCTIGDTGKIVD
jgi:hypothetical protein